MLTHRGQSLVEYTMLIGVITLALIYMGTGIKRGLQSLVKVTADQVGNQQNSEPDYDNPQAGYLMASNTFMQQNKSKQVIELTGRGLGVPQYLHQTIYNEKTESFTNTLTNGGFMSEPGGI